MNYIQHEVRFPSKDGKNTVYAEVFTPKTATAKGIIQISHGMVDYTANYKPLVSYFTERGYIVAGNHHLGHGKTAACDDDFGFFSSKGGIDFLLSDLHSMNKYLRKEFPALPIVLLGHSMGSFLARLYTVKYPGSISGVIIHGTAGPNPILPFGKGLARLKKIFCGEKYRSKTVRNLAFMGYNSKFDKSEGEHAWLTRDSYAVKGRDDDKYTSFIFTLSGYIDLFNMLGRSNSRSWFSSYPKDMPTLIVSGDMDPVGNYGKGPAYVYKHLIMERCTSVSYKMYEGARHELHNETNKEEIFSDILSWLKEII